MLCCFTTKKKKNVILQKESSKLKHYLLHQLSVKLHHIGDISMVLTIKKQLLQYHTMPQQVAGLDVLTITTDFILFQFLFTS